MTLSMEALTYSKARSSTYILNEKATLDKLQAAAIKPAIEVTRNIGSTTIHLSTGAYVSVVVPLVLAWKDIEGDHIDDMLVDGMDKTLLTFLPVHFHRAHLGTEFWPLPLAGET